MIFAPKGSLLLLGATALENFGVEADPIEKKLKPILAVIGGFLASAHRASLMSAAGHIALRGVRVHNLKSIDLDSRIGKLIVFCGLSGSGKSSLALDTLYAEGQRRYIESFSAYTRQFLQRLEKPEAERIDGIPPAIAVTGKNTSRSSRSTVGTATETNDYLRLLFAKIGHVFCLKCGREVRCDSPQSAAETLAALPPGTRYMIAFPALPEAMHRHARGWRRSSSNWRPACARTALSGRSSTGGW